MRKGVFFILLLCQLGCSSMFSGRQFIDEMEHDGDGMWIPGKDFPVMSGDESDGRRTWSQVMDRTPASSSYKVRHEHSASLEEELKNLEDSQSGHLLRQYREYQHLLPSTSQRIFFLKLPTSYARLEYLKTFGPVSGDVADKGGLRGEWQSNLKDNIDSFVRTGQITIGMTKAQVQSAWGRPMRVDVAGNPQKQNERWSFYQQGKLKQVFFEGGIVEGWNIE